MTEGWSKIGWMTLAGFVIDLVRNRVAGDLRLPFSRVDKILSAAHSGHLDPSIRFRRPLLLCGVLTGSIAAYFILMIILDWKIGSGNFLLFPMMGTAE